MKRRRIKNDYYPSENLIAPILKRYVDIQGTVLEPFCGNNDLGQHFPGIITNDLYPQKTFEPTFTIDALNPALYLYTEPQWVVTNPPYEHAVKAVKLALEHSSIGVAMLLRLSFIEPCRSRYNLLRDYQQFMSHIIILNPRPRFRTDIDNSDQVTACWLVWDFRHSGGTEIIYAHGWR